MTRGNCTILDAVGLAPKIFNMAENNQQNYNPNAPADDITAAQNAVDIIRAKVDRVYSEEPEIRQELVQAKVVRYRSRHQQFMYELSGSGKDLATIQTEWHNYYQSLPAVEKHKVWQEFYESQSSAATQTNRPAPSNPQTLSSHKHQAAKPVSSIKNAQDLRNTIRSKVTANGQLKTKHHVQSLLFGLGMGALSLVVILFGFFNEIIIAPFIQPSRTALATPIIISNDSAPSSSEYIDPKVLIPKINAAIPVNYSETTRDEANIENDLESGVVHYPNTALPGQNGNAVYFGHSSSNIFNRGKFKFAFLFLHELVINDTFYLTNDGKIYAYKVISRTIVEPNEVSVLGPVSGQVATATLITCNPPGTSLHRLIVVGQQINPEPSSNSVAAVSSTVAPSILPGNGPTLLNRLLSTLIGKIGLIIIVVVGLILTVRWVRKPNY